MQRHTERHWTGETSPGVTGFSGPAKPPPLTQKRPDPKAEALREVSALATAAPSPTPAFNQSSQDSRAARAGANRSNAGDERCLCFSAHRAGREIGEIRAAIRKKVIARRRPIERLSSGGAYEREERINAGSRTTDRRLSRHRSRGFLRKRRCSYCPPCTLHRHQLGSWLHRWRTTGLHVRYI